VKNSDSGVFEKARAYAFLLLKFRLRSCREIAQRLKRKKFSDEIIAKTIAFLEDKGFLNDRDFSRAWISDRINRPLGLRRLKIELKIKGVSVNIIDNQIEEAKKNYNEAAIVREIAEAKFKKLKAIEPRKAKKRIYDYFLRRGFTPDVIIDVMTNLKNES
jgi:regulatory protein